MSGLPMLSGAIRRIIRSAAPSLASIMAWGVTVSQMPSMLRLTRPGSKLKKVAITTEAGTGPIAADRDAK